MFNFKVASAPTTKGDMDVVAWGMEWVLAACDRNPTFFNEQFYDLPYDQGHGEVTLEMCTWEVAKDLCYGEVPTTKNYTGWVLTCNYSDSMTSLYATPIWEDPTSRGIGFNRYVTLEP